MIVKYCPRCKLKKPVSHFGSSKRTKDKYRCYCLECESKLSAKCKVGFDYKNPTPPVPIIKPAEKIKWEINNMAKDQTMTGRMRQDEGAINAKTY